MARAYWNWLNELRRRLKNPFSKAPPPSKFTRRRPLFERLGPVEALEERWVLSPTLSLMDIGSNEGAVLGFEVWLDSPNEGSITIQFSTADGTATSPDDYYGVTSGTFTIPPATLPASAFPTFVDAIDISTVNNHMDDGDRQFSLNIDSITGATLGDGNAVGTIFDDDQTPVANDNGPYTVVHDEMGDVSDPGVLANDVATENATLTPEVVAEPSNGWVSLNEDGSFVYEPFPGFIGSDSFTYHLFDGAAFSNPATVEIVAVSHFNRNRIVVETAEKLRWGFGIRDSGAGDC